MRNIALIMASLSLAALPFSIASAKMFNSNPTTTADSITVPCNTITGPHYVLSNDSDPDNDTLILTGVWAGYGSAEIENNGITYGSSSPQRYDTIYYDVSDGHGGTAVGVVHVTTDC